MESEKKTNTLKRDGDSPVERNSQSDGQEGVEANIPRVASTINRLHLHAAVLLHIQTNQLSQLRTSPYMDSL